MEAYHIPVLLKESIEGLSINPDGIYIDATFGGGGHSKTILSELSSGKLIAFDQDSDVEKNLPDAKNFTFVNHNFRYIEFFLRYYKIEKVDGILADLGVSSHHFNTEKRGFSFRFDTPLDMRMNCNQKLKAVDIINEYSEEKLFWILKNFGETEKTGQLVNAIITARRQKPIKTTIDLVTILMQIIPERFKNKELAKIFQALRIEVNGEIEALKELLLQSAQILKPHGRIVFITYHSLEDRLAKNFIRSGNFEGILEKDFYGNAITPFEPINRKVITPTLEEQEKNPRSRSAKLRIAKRTVLKNIE